MTPTIAAVNAALRGEGVERLEPVLARMGRGRVLPHWYEQLRTDHTLPNLDGKTIGSVVEMLLLAVLELDVLNDVGIPLKINPARGVDFPDLDLGVKSPSENFCTSEPFFSAYERLIGSEYDILVLLTDYQKQKRNPPLRLQVISWDYLTKSEVADVNLCQIARTNRVWLLEENEAWAKKLFRFLAYVNQSDWRAKQLVSLMRVLRDPRKIEERIEQIAREFDAYNSRKERSGGLLLPYSELDSLTAVTKVKPLHLGVLDAGDTWVVETQKDAGRYPNDSEWARLVSGKLDGRIGMSFALQWRYNFGRIFPATARQRAGIPDGREAD